MDLSRFGSNNYQPLLRDFLQEKYADKKIDVAIAVLSPSLDLLLNRIFQPMFTTKTRGMGMGLSICKSVIDSPNGHIWASANVPRGSIFQFELPANGAKH